MLLLGGERSALRERTMEPERRLVMGLGAVVVLLLVLTGIGLWTLASETGVAGVVEVVIVEELEQTRRATVAPAPPPSDNTRPYAWVDPTPRCPARLVVETEDGHPVLGAAKIGPPEDRWHNLDAEGTAPWSERRCGKGHNVYIRQKNGSTVLLWVPWEDTDEVLLTIGELREAIVAPVNTDGRPVEAEVRPGEALGDGRFRITGRADSLSIRAAAPGEQGARVEVPLDGLIHEVEVKRDREVVVHLLCDQCSGRLMCDEGQERHDALCTGEDDLYVCLCPADDAVLWLRTPDVVRDFIDHVQPLARVDAGAEEVTVDVRGELGSIRVCFEPPSTEEAPLVITRVRRPGTPPSAGRSLGLSERASCVEHDGLLPGEWMLDVDRLPDHTTTHRVTMASGEPVVLTGLER